MKKLKLLNYYDELNDRQKEVIKEKKSLILYYNYLEELEELTLEEKGAMLSAIIFYGETHGTQEIPSEYADIINKDRALRMLFYSWQEREAKATKEWCNHRGSYTRKYTYFVFEDGSKKKIKGNVDNAPKTFKDCMYSDYNLKEFIDYGNENEWNRPYKELEEEWYYLTMPEENNDNPQSLL